MTFLEKSKGELSVSDELAIGLMSRLDAFCAFAKAEGILIRPYSARCIQDFRHYPADVQAAIYQRFGYYLEAVESVVASGISLQDTPRALWHLFKLRGLRPTSDLFSTISDGSVVEVYLPNHTQWYRSFNYYEYTSYSLGDLICYKWNQLFEHNEALAGYIAETSEEIFCEKVKCSVFPSLEPAVSRELFSDQKYVGKLELKTMSPVLDADGYTEALAVVWNMELLKDAEKSNHTGSSHSVSHREPLIDPIRLV
ncbi:MAG: hypothetical protein P4M08_14645 [Oligoflexia bacterium]|nr:hypothetical protein [Oligoflexia bacterium]